MTEPTVGHTGAAKATAASDHRNREPSADERGSDQAPRAIIYVPGIGRASSGAEADAAAARFTAALHGQFPAESFQFSKCDDVSYGPTRTPADSKPVFSAPVRRITRAAGGRVQSVVDVYLLDYRARLTGDWKERPLPVQVLALTGHLITGFAKAFPRFRIRPSRRGKGIVHQAQALWMLSLLALVSVYFGFLTVALLRVVQVSWDSLRAEAGEEEVTPASADEDGAVAGPVTPGDDPAGADDAGPAAEPRAAEAASGPATYEPPDWWTALTAWFREARAELGTAAAGVVGRNVGLALRQVAGGFLGMMSEFWRSIGNFVAPPLVLGGIALVALKRSRDRIEEIAVVYIGAWEYLTPGLRHSEVVGQLTALLTQLDKERAEEGSRPYEEVSLVAYSFGSIVAIDALFPFEKGSPAAGYAKVNELVTVGCPYDLVRTYFNRYTEPRWHRTPQELCWRNIYCPRDVLGSNFRNDMERGQPQDRFPIRSGSVPDWNVTPPIQDPVTPEQALHEAAPVVRAAGLTFSAAVAFLIGVAAANPFGRLTAGGQLLVVVALLAVLPAAVLLAPSVRSSWTRLWRRTRGLATGDEPPSAPSDRPPRAGITMHNEVFHAGVDHGLTGLRGAIPPGMRAHGWYFSDQPGAEDAGWMTLPQSLRKGCSS